MTAHLKTLIFIAIALITSKFASSFPADFQPDSSQVATDYQRVETKRAGYEQTYDPELLSTLPCVIENGTYPSTDSMSSYSTKIMFDTSLQQIVCHANHETTSPISSPNSVYIIQSPGTNSYPSNHLFIYNVGCQPSQVLIKEICINLQEPIPYENDDHCVDYVEIKPPINGHPNLRHCGHKTFDNAPYTLSETDQTNVEVMFRTSGKNNAHPGFYIRLRCVGGLQEEEEELLRYLELSSKPSMAHQHQVHQACAVQWNSLDTLVNFASYQCNSPTTLSISSHWSIVQLALQNEEADEEEFRKAAEDVLQCFPASQIAFARIAIAENYK